MSPVVRRRPLKAGGGVAVPAAGYAGVVNADVTADHTAAVFALAGILPPRDLDAEDVPDQPVVNTLSRLDPVRRDIDSFGAAHDLHPVLPGGPRQ